MPSAKSCKLLKFPVRVSLKTLTGLAKLENARLELEIMLFCGELIFFFSFKNSEDFEASKT